MITLTPLVLSVRGNKHADNKEAEKKQKVPFQHQSLALSGWS